MDKAEIGFAVTIFVGQLPILAACYFEHIQSRSCTVKKLFLSSSYELSVMWTKLKMVVQFLLSWFNHVQKNWRWTSLNKSKPASQKVVLISNSWVKLSFAHEISLVKVV